MPYSYPSKCISDSLICIYVEENGGLNANLSNSFLNIQVLCISVFQPYDCSLAIVHVSSKLYVLSLEQLDRDEVHLYSFRVWKRFQGDSYLRLALLVI